MDIKIKKSVEIYIDALIYLGGVGFSEYYTQPSVSPLLTCEMLAEDLKIEYDWLLPAFELADGEVVFDYIGVNRWNSDYKRQAAYSAARAMTEGRKTGSTV